MAKTSKVSTKPINGMIRIDSRKLLSYERTTKGWKRAGKDFNGILAVVKLYKAEGKFKELMDAKEPRFLKGAISKEGLPIGARINILPDGQKLEKAFSLFSPNLTLHDQLSHDHWDVIYQNKGGTWSYVYTLKKRKDHMAGKYRKVELFEKNYRRLSSNVIKGLFDESDFMAVPMHTLLQTYMRVGNETYYKAHGHRGLTTLIKRNISVRRPEVTFDYVGKDGVPIKIIKRFLDEYTERLNSILAKRKKDEFVFSKNGSVLREHDFKDAFLRYCGHEFYPHIVRSHYATMKVKKFLKENKNITKERMRNLFMEIAHNLGHKRFNKKKQDWQESYAVTVHSYIQPELVEKLQKRIRD